MTSRKQLGLTRVPRKVVRAAFVCLLAGSLLGPALSLALPAGLQMGRGRLADNEHLGTWLQQHRNLTPEQQERALQTEPGFNRLPPDLQQKLLFRLRQINRMPPDQRQRTVDHIEAMERLSPQMRQQVRFSVQQFHALPDDRQRLVKKAYRDLRDYPPEQRSAMMRSSQFAQEFTPQERGILSNILSVEPYEPVHGAGFNNGLGFGR